MVRREEGIFWGVRGGGRRGWLFGRCWKGGSVGVCGRNMEKGVRRKKKTVREKEGGVCFFFIYAFLSPNQLHFPFPFRGVLFIYESPITFPRVGAQKPHTKIFISLISKATNIGSILGNCCQEGIGLGIHCLDMEFEGFLTG